MESRFLKLPFTKSHSGGVAETEDSNQHIKNKMIQVLFTTPGERVNLPDFGCRLRDLVFEGNNEVIISATRFTIFQALTRWMGEEVEINNVKVFSEEEALYIQIFYSPLDTRIPDSLEVAYKL